MIIHYNCTIGSFLLHYFLLIYHPYPPSFHEMIFTLVGQQFAIDYIHTFQMTFFILKWAQLLAGMDDQWLIGGGGGGHGRVVLLLTSQEVGSWSGYFLLVDPNPSDSKWSRI